MKIKKIKVTLKNGMSFPELFDTATMAVKTVGISQILKMEEVNQEIKQKHDGKKYI